MASAAVPTLVSGGENGQLHVWDLKDRKLHHSMQCHEVIADGLTATHSMNVTAANVLR
jgi:hypothetical protein